MSTTDDKDLVQLVGGCDYQGQEFGANYPDSVCIDGFLWNADSGYSQGEGWVYTSGGELPCPNCNRNAAIESLAEALVDDDESGQMSIEQARPIATNRIEAHVARMDEKWDPRRRWVVAR